MRDVSWIELDRAATQDGGEISLRCRDGIYEIRINGWELMSNRAHRSEEALAALTCTELGDAARVLLGGLGLGYSLRAALDCLPADALVMVAELLPALVEWNRGVLGKLAGHPLRDPRVALRIGDVGAIIDAAETAFDAILLDVDNGPQPLTDQGNQRLYGPDGLAAARRALRPGGVLAVWSADPAPAFEQALAAAGFTAESVEVSPRGTPDGPMHTILLGKLAKAPGKT
jgi:spermidine synthase